MKINITLIVWISFVSCNLNKWDLDDKSNNLIPNYSLTLEMPECTSYFNTNIFSLDKDNFVTVTEGADNQIRIIKITQRLENDEWQLDAETITSLDGDKLLGFEKASGSYFVATSANGGVILHKLDGKLNYLGSFTEFESFIDTSYNDISNLEIKSIIADSSSGVYLCGQLSSFSKKYSCLVKLDHNLKPKFVKTYFENDTVTSVLPIDEDNFLAINHNGQNIELIRDNTKGNAYKKFDLDLGETFLAPKLLTAESKLYISGAVKSGIAKTIEISITNNFAFVSDVKNYKVTSMAAGTTSRNSILISGVANSSGNNNAFVSEYHERSYLWCNTFNDDLYVSCLSTGECIDVGFVFLYTVSQNNGYKIHLVRTDEEGATINNPFDKNCLQ